MIIKSCREEIFCKTTKWPPTIPHWQVCWVKEVLYLICNEHHLSAYFGTLMTQLQSFTAQKVKFSIKDFFSKCDQILNFLRICSHLLRKSLMENLIFCAVLIVPITSSVFFCDTDYYQYCDTYYKDVLNYYNNKCQKLTTL